MSKSRRIQAGQSVNASTTLSLPNGAGGNTYTTPNTAGNGYAVIGNPLQAAGIPPHAVNSGWISATTSGLVISPSVTKFAHLKATIHALDGNDGVSRVSVKSENDPTIEYRHISSSPNVALIIRHNLNTDSTITLLKEELLAIQYEGIHLFNKKTPKLVIKKLLSIAALTKTEKAWLISEMTRVGWSKTP